ncbi:MAG TPA: diacylglycerol kinase family protein, partial [Ardenticatenaceae bacterium]|nr:diacylglycerol kinase family protein [Ardenticatenaceae bacterium]
MDTPQHIHTATKRAKVFINPVSGLRQAEVAFPLLEQVLNEFNCPFERHDTQADEPCTALVRQAVGEGYDLVIAMGGDGTIMEVANGLVGSNAVLGVIPLGSANVFAAELGIPNDPNAAARLLFEENQRICPVDLGRIDDRYFALRASIGLEAEVIEETDRDLKARLGRLAYVVKGIQTLRQAEQAVYTIETENIKVETQGMTVYVTNAATAGQRPFQLGPDIKMDDGLLDVCIFSASGLTDAAALVGKIILGDYSADVHARYLKARWVRVEADPPQKVQLDGEMHGETPVEIEVVPAAIRVICPAAPT